MRILHTSDWHIGRSLYGRKRYEGFKAFILAMGQPVLKTAWTGFQQAVDDFALTFFERGLRVALPEAGFEHDISQQIVELAAAIAVTTRTIERHWVDSEIFIGYCV